MKVYQINCISIQHNHAFPSFEPMNGLLFSTHDAAQSHIDDMQSLGIGLIVPIFNEVGDDLGTELKEYSKKDAYSIKELDILDLRKELKEPDYPF